MHLKYNYCFQQFNDRYMAIADYNANEKNLLLLWVNAMGKEIMELMQGDISVEELVGKLQEQYSSVDDEIESSVSRFINELDRAELLVREK